MVFAIIILILKQRIELPCFYSKKWLNSKLTLKIKIIWKLSGGLTDKDIGWCKTK